MNVISNFAGSNGHKFTLHKHWRDAITYMNYYICIDCGYSTLDHFNTEKRFLTCDEQIIKNIIE